MVSNGMSSQATKQLPKIILPKIIKTDVGKALILHDDWEAWVKQITLTLNAIIDMHNDEQTKVAELARLIMLSQRNSYEQ